MPCPFFFFNLKTKNGIHVEQPHLGGDIELHQLQWRGGGCRREKCVFTSRVPANGSLPSRPKNPHAKANVFFRNFLEIFYSYFFERKKHSAMKVTQNDSSVHARVFSVSRPGIMIFFFLASKLKWGTVLGGNFRWFTWDF